MLRRRVHCASLTTATAVLGGVWQHSGGGSSSTQQHGTHLCTARRTGFFDGLSDMMKKNMPSGAGGVGAGGAGGGSSGGGNTSNSKGSGSPPFPPGLDMQKLKTMQDMFNAQPPEKQEQLMKQALEMQKMMSKMPGFKKMSQMNTQVLEELMRQKHQSQPQSGGKDGSSGDKVSQPFAGTQTPRASSASGGSPGGGASRATPTLDDLKKINLGPELEALFAELKSIRTKKNEYRDLYNAEKIKAATSEKNRLAAEASEASLRGKLKKAEQEVMLLTSENMEVREGAKNVKQLTAENAKLRSEVKSLQAKLQGGTVAGSPQYHDMQAALQAKEEALRSLGRKVERMRRRDPLLHFSLCCNDVTRLCELKPSASSTAGASAASASSAMELSSAMKELLYHMNHSQNYIDDEVAKETAEELFADLQGTYVAVQQQAWQLAATGGGNAAAATTLGRDSVKPHAAARAYTAFLHRFFLSKVPYSNYDAVITVKVNRSTVNATAAAVSALRELFASPSLGYTVEKLSESHDEARYLIAAPADATTRDMLRRPGPFAFTFALRAVTERLNNSSTPAGSSAEVLADGNKALAAALASFTVTHAQPFVSDTLIRNSNRVAVRYETARASGPGGQAVNVAETQIKAKLFIDQNPTLGAGAVAYSNSITVGDVTLRVVGSDGSADGSSTTPATAAEEHRGGGGGGATDAAAATRSFAFFAESQDSRSALQNKTNATEKLLTVERKKFNEGPLRSPFGRCEDVEQLLKRLYLPEAGEVKLEAEVVRWCVEAAAATGPEAIPALDAVLVLAFQRLVEEARL